MPGGASWRGNGGNGGGRGGAGADGDAAVEGAVTTVTVRKEDWEWVLAEGKSLIATLKDSSRYYLFPAPLYPTRTVTSG